MPKRPIKPLNENDIITISDLMNTTEEKLLGIKGISEKSLEKIYDAVQIFVENNHNQAIKEESSSEEEVKEDAPIEEELNEDLNKVE